MGPKKKGKDAKHKGKEEPRKKSVPKTPVEQEVLPEIITETIVEYLHEGEGESPINIEWSTFFKIRTSSIEWNNWVVPPTSLSLKNSAYNVILTATWPPGMTPWVSKGPLNSRYDFAQAHFHWGPDSNSGSDHHVGGVALPFEVHLVFYKAQSGSLAEAKKEEDGVIIFSYLYRISEHDNAMIQPITSNIQDVSLAYSEKELEPIPLSQLFSPITDDFIAYLGTMKYKAVYGVTFIIFRETHYISERQLAGFRNLKDRHENPMILNEREVQSCIGRYVFAVNPKNTNITSVLLTSNATSKHSLHSEAAHSTTSSKSGSKKSKKSIKGKKRPSKHKKSKKKSKISAKKKSSKRPKSKKSSKKPKSKKSSKKPKSKKSSKKRQSKKSSKKRQSKKSSKKRQSKKPSKKPKSKKQKK